MRERADLNSRTANVRFGSWLCKNARSLNRDRRSHLSETALVAQLASEFNLAIELKKIILLAFRFFEFSHSQGQTRTSSRSRTTSASLIGRLRSSTFRLSPLQCRCHSRARASLRNRHLGPSTMGSEDEAEQSFGRPCRQCDGRSKRTYELTSSIVLQGTSFHRSVELEVFSYRV